MSATETETQTESTAVVSATPAALTKLKDLLTKDESAIGIRLGVIGGGCAGLNYQMDPCDEAIDGDVTQTIDGITFYLHPMVVPYLKGITIDFVEALMDGGFKFINPNATSTCGCGTSFGI